MNYMFLLLVFAGLAALGAVALVCRAYVLGNRSETKSNGWTLLVGALVVVILAVPCSVIAFVGHAFIDVTSDFDWVKSITSWIVVPPLCYYLLYCLARRFHFFRTYSCKSWVLLVYSGVLTTWAFEALIMYELATTS